MLQGTRAPIPIHPSAKQCAAFVPAHSAAASFALNRHSSHAAIFPVHFALALFVFSRHNSCAALFPAHFAFAMFALYRHSLYASRQSYAPPQGTLPIG
eukprot:scaffold134186_cov20-Tisochrysis_lutea.AAC.2